MKNKILIIYTGGTIGMKKNIAYENSDDIFKRLMSEVQNNSNSNLELMAISQIIDSSQLRPKVINEILSIIEKEYLAYTGFLIISGTDTMSYLQSCLKWAIEALHKPIILTGAINTIDYDPKEGINNILFALNEIIDNRNKGIIAIAMNNKLLKKPTTKFNSYSKNPYIESINSSLENYRKKLLKGKDQLQIYPYKENLQIEVIHLNPFISIEDSKFKDGLIVLTYGQGTILDDQKLKDRISAYEVMGKPVIILSQVYRNKLSVETYEASSYLKNIDCTIGKGSFLEEGVGCLNYQINKKLLFL